MRGFFPKNSTKIPLKTKLLVWVIKSAIQTGDYLWLATQTLAWIGWHLEVDREKKTWKLTSDAAYSPEWTKRTYDDIEKIFKSDPSKYKVTEERKDGKFHRFIVETV